MTSNVVIVGQGYVGLPLAYEAVMSGLRVTGLELGTDRVEALNAGSSHVDDISDEQVRAMLEGGYRASTDPSCIRDADVVVICVPTPLDDAGGPDLSAVTGSASTIGEHLSRRSLVVLESTTYPGTTEEVVLPILERGSGGVHGDTFLLAFSPERVNPGDPHFGVKNTPKLVGGVTDEATQAAHAFYSRFVDEVIALRGSREAETAKLLENTYRHVNIALVNEMARFCHDLGIDIWEVIRGASTKPFGFQAFRPGPGVGGHCIPIDPNYLSFRVKQSLGYQFRFVELAQEINNSMPTYVVQRVQDLLNDEGRALRGARVLLIGVTYKPNIADERESPALPVAKVLAAKGAQLEYFDPFVQTWSAAGEPLQSVPDVYEAAAGADVTVVLQGHRSIDLARLSSTARLLFDTTGSVLDEHVHRL